MDLNDEINYGVEAFHADLLQALGDRLVEVESDAEDYLGTLKLGRIEDFISQAYPGKLVTMRDFSIALNEIGAKETDDFAAKVSKTIFNFLQQGMTLTSMGRGELAKPDELKRWTTYKASELIWNHISSEAGIDDSTLAGTYTQEFCWIVASAGVNFFQNKHNIAGKAIQSGFLCGIGTLRLWLYDEVYFSLTELPA